MGIYKVKPNVRKYPASPTMNLNYVNFLACISLASDWFRNNQLLSEFTHAQHHEPVPFVNKDRKTKHYISSRLLTPAGSNVLPN